LPVKLTTLKLNASYVSTY